MEPRRRRRPELRTRTGCNTCRQRRVKCSEEKPLCKPCHSLGLNCSYDRTLKWQRVQLPEAHRGIRPPQAIARWMFLHAATLRDYEPSSRQLTGLSDSDSEDSMPDVDVNDDDDYEGNELNRSFSETALHLSSLSNPKTITPAAWLSPLRLTAEQSRLWVYFHEAIAPSCVLNPQLNPYQDVILKIAASTGNTSPLFHAIMAISANQLYILGHKSLSSSLGDYRHRVLRSLRLETTKLEKTTLDAASAAPILATVMALVFLDILSDCSASWVVHSNFARSLICKFRDECHIVDPDVEALFNFVGGYIVAHEVYAHSAWDASSNPCGGPVSNMCDDSNLQTLTGCSTEFFQILSDVNSLASEFSVCSKHSNPDPEVFRNLNQRRNSLERQLHAWEPSLPILGAGGNIPESTLMTESKRLTGLLYLYSRIDHLGPYDPCIARLSTKILDLVAKLPSRSNAVLWPLFMVATLGLRPEDDAERMFVLEKIDSLLQSRQMRYIKKARSIIIELWKLRDLQENTPRMGWDILLDVAQQERISLF